MEDLDQLLELAQKTGFGLTTLQPRPNLLTQRIQRSMQAFSQLVTEPAGQSYLFVMEEVETGHVVGTCGIASKVGGFEPFYTFRLETEIFESETLSLSQGLEVLTLVAEHNGPGEIGTLFLDPSCQGKGLGGLLSRCRFLFMAEFPDFFEKTIVAEMRGVVDDQGRSPFWEAIGSHFFGIDFKRADYLSMKSKSFIADLMPRHPIYVAMLPKEAQRVIGEVHPNTLPARMMLQKEGFSFNGLVDIFEAGPLVSCKRQQIRTVRESQRANLAGFCEPDSQEARKALVCNTRLDFRCVRTVFQANAADEIRIPEADAAALEVQAGDELRFIAS